jgi:hypothetical protein
MPKRQMRPNKPSGKVSRTWNDMEKAKICRISCDQNVMIRFQNWVQKYVGSLGLGC